MNDTLKQFRHGLYKGIPIALGYLSVSFGFGILAVKCGLSVVETTMISLTNVTSAGQVAGVEIIKNGGTLLEMALVQLTINIRYALMAMSLSQKKDKSFTLPKRLIASMGITDEIFAVCAIRKEKLKFSFMIGVIIISVIGWVTGTYLGASAGRLLPEAVTDAMGILLYGMFAAIIIPPAKKERSILIVITISAALSVICKYLIPALSSGFAVIICAVVASVVGAIIAPKEVEED